MPSDYLGVFRDIIDEYNSPNADWTKQLRKLRAEEAPIDPEEKVIDIPSSDGLILPN